MVPRSKFATTETPMRRKPINALLALGLSGGAHAGDAESILPIIQENCIQCHGKKGKVKGMVNLLEISYDLASGRWRGS
jgi:mono/diheme cytochrome c family protein